VGGNNYWVRLVLRESAELGVFLYMGWIFWSCETNLSLTHFPIPTNEPSSTFPLPPIHKVVSPSPRKKCHKVKVPYPLCWAHSCKGAVTKTLHCTLYCCKGSCH